MTPVPVALGPHADPALMDAIVRAGGQWSPMEGARALVWDAGPERFPETLPESIRWVQLYSAGVEEWFAAGIIARHPGVEWTSAAGAFAATVAEHALTLLLAGVRSLPDQITATSWRQQEFFGRVGTLLGEAGVNIATMAVSRNRPGGNALMALTIDNPLSPDLVERLRSEPGFVEVRFIRLGD